MRDALKIYLPITALIIGGFVFTWQFVEPAPPTTITIATGMKGGSYAGYGDLYKNILARSGVTVKIRRTAGAKENIDLLNKPNSGGSNRKLSLIASSTSISPLQNSPHRSPIVNILHTKFEINDVVVSFPATKI